MKIENQRDNIKEPKNIFIQNLPKPKKWWQEYALIIATIALVISIYTANLSRKEFIAAHRPFIYVSSRKNDDGTMDLKSSMICCLNAPTKIVDQKFNYILVKTNGNEEIIKIIPLKPELLAPYVLYPSEKTSHQVYFPYDIGKEIMESGPDIKFRKKVRIKYKELSTDRTYFFEAVWDYDRKHNIWIDKQIKGN